MISANSDGEKALSELNGNEELATDPLTKAALRREKK
jgi:hypothetical protein